MPTGFTANSYWLGVKDQVITLRDSTDVLGRRWSASRTSVLVDSGHVYVRVFRNIRAWLPHLEPKGLIVSHDVLGPSHPGELRAAG